MMIETMKLTGTRAYPPRVSEFTRPFWSALGEGRWITTQCEACGRATFPPKSVCPHCWSSKLEWTDLSSRGHLYSWTRVHAAPTVFAADAPYSVCIVDLDSGIRLACKLIETAGSSIRIGMPVEIVSLKYEDGPLFAARACTEGEVRSK